MCFCMCLCTQHTWRTCLDLGTATATTPKNNPSVQNGGRRMWARCSRTRSASKLETDDDWTGQTLWGLIFAIYLYLFAVGPKNTKCPHMSS